MFATDDTISYRLVVFRVSVAGLPNGMGLQAHGLEHVQQHISVVDRVLQRRAGRLELPGLRVRAGSGQN